AMPGFQRARERRTAGPLGQRRAQWRPQGVIFGLVVGQQELLEQFPPQRGSQQRARVVVPPARDPADLHELSAQRVVHREHHAHVELEIHVSSLTWAWVGALGRAPGPGRARRRCLLVKSDTQSYLKSSFKKILVCLSSESRIG